MEEQRKEKILLPKLPPVSSLLLEIGAATEEGGHSNTLQHEGESVTSKEQQHQQLPQLLFKQHQHPAFPANLVPSIPTPLPPHPYYRPQFYEEVYSRATAAASSPSYEELNHLRDGFRNQELQHPQTLPHASSYRHHSLDQFMALQHQQHPPHPPPPPQEEVVIDLTNEDANGDNSNNQLAHCSHSQTSQIANDDESDDHIVISSAHQPPLKRSREDEEQLPQAYQQRLEQQQQYYQNQQEYYQQQQQQQRQVELLPRPQTHRQVHEEFIYLGYIGTRIINLDFDIFQRRVIGKQSQIHFSSYTRSLNVFGKFGIE